MNQRACVCACVRKGKVGGREGGREGARKEGRKGGRKEGRREGGREPFVDEFSAEYFSYNSFCEVGLWPELVTHLCPWSGHYWSRRRGQRLLDRWRHITFRKELGMSVSCACRSTGKVEKGCISAAVRLEKEKRKGKRSEGYLLFLKPDSIYSLHRTKRAIQLMPL